MKPIPPVDLPDKRKLAVARHNVTDMRHAVFVSTLHRPLPKEEMDQLTPDQCKTPYKTIDVHGMAPQFDGIINPKMTWSPHLKALFEGVYEGQNNKKIQCSNDSNCINGFDDDNDDLILVTTSATSSSSSSEYDWDEGQQKDKKQKPGSLSLSPSQSKSKMESDPSPLAKLYGHRDTIFKHICQNYIVPSWKQSVLLTNYKSKDVAFTPCQRVKFPPPQDLNVNMLPFVLGQKETLPEPLQPYYDMIIMHCPLQDSELGKVLYLTVQEGWVDAGQTQRRGGLHIEAPRYGLEQIEKNRMISESSSSSSSPSGSVTSSITSAINAGEWIGRPGGIGWGRGVLKDDEFVGGLYMASTVANTCVVYHALVDKAATDNEGGCEHLRHLIPTENEEYERFYRQRGRPYRPDVFGRYMEANELVWMTDRTPHEVIPQTEGQYRQFFRLVTSSVSIWNKARNTKNDNVELPSDVLVVDVPSRSQN